MHFTAAQRAADISARALSGWCTRSAVSAAEDAMLQRLWGSLSVMRVLFGRAYGRFACRRTERGHVRKWYVPLRGMPAVSIYSSKFTL